MNDKAQDGRTRLLVVKLSSLGDLFHALPAVHALKTGLDAELHWVTQRCYVDLVRHFDDVERVISFPRKDVARHWRSFLAELRAIPYDLAVDLQGLLKSACVTRLARARQRIGPSFRREGVRWLYSSVAPAGRRDRHAVDVCLDVPKHLGLDPDSTVFPLTLPAAEVRQPGPRVAMAPNSRWRTKNWPPACFAAVARRLRQTRNASIFLVGGEEDAGVCRAIEQAVAGGVVNTAGRKSLVETGSLLAAMDLVIANDSGPGHMAAALGVPTLMIFGPTDAVRTGPYGELHRVASARLPCRPCFSRTCRRPGIPCLAGVTPESVGEAALEMLARQAASPRPAAAASGAA